MPELLGLNIANNGFTFATITADGNGHEPNSLLMDLNIKENNLTDVNELRKLRIFPHLGALKISGNLFSDLEIDGETLKKIFPSLYEIHVRKSVNIDGLRQNEITSTKIEIKRRRSSS